MLVNWLCFKCGHKWINETKIEPRQCPMCGCCNIYVPRVVKQK